jgi:acetyl esterase/lipase
MHARIALAVTCFAALLAQAAGDPRFQRWDANHDGVLTAEELPDRIRANFSRVDADGNGKITVEEHQTFLKQAQPNRPQPNPGQPRMNPRFRDAVVSHVDIPYADDDNPRHRLDLFLPKKPTNDAPLPVVVFIHGGGWMGGDKGRAGGHVLPSVASGNYAGASIGYRLSGEAQWPAQIHDCKAAIRWLKANAKTYNLDPDHIAVWGSSAGGHLVSMLGLTNGREDMEGEVGKNLDQNSRVACVLDWYGPANMVTMNTPPGRIDHSAADSPEGRLLGGAIADVPEKARHASPVTHVTADAPPFLIAHGDEDGTVPFGQSVELVEAMRKAGVDPEPIFLQFEGGGHGKGIAGPELTKIVSAFLDMHLRGQESELKSMKLPAVLPRQ